MIKLSIIVPVYNVEKYIRPCIESIFMQEIDDSMLTKDVIRQLKTNVVSGIKNSPNSVRRINAGVTFLYIYSSVENIRLYEIKIDSKDIK